MEHPPGRLPIVIAWDVSDITAPDVQTLDALAHLQLNAHRMGAQIELHNACPLLVALIRLAGLADVLVVSDRSDSGVEVQGKVEELEQPGVDEEVHRGDCPG